MAGLAREKFLVLLVDEGACDCLSIRLPGPHDAHLSFVGSICDGHDLVAFLRQGGEAEESARLPLSDLLLLGLMMPRKDGIGVVQWLQSQPFEGVTVVLLDNQAEGRAFSPLRRPSV